MRQGTVFPLGLAAFLLLTTAQLTFGFELVTQKEAEAEQSAKPGAANSLADVPYVQDHLPRIEVITPHLDSQIKSPLDIKLIFVPKVGTLIRPETFHVYYGWLGIDITDRIRANATVTSDGVTASNAEIPKGKHVLTLSIHDTNDDIAERQISFTVQ